MDTGEAADANGSEWMWDDFMDAVEENDADGVTLLLDSLPATSREEVLVIPIAQVTALDSWASWYLSIQE